MYVYAITLFKTDALMVPNAVPNLSVTLQSNSVKAYNKTLQKFLFSVECRVTAVETPVTLKITFTFSTKHDINDDQSLIIIHVA